MQIKTILSLALISFTIVACGANTELKKETASRIAMPAFMVERTIATNGMTLNAWERMHNRREPATIYIEGDGFVTKAIKDGSEQYLSNPTPENPVALHLASRDLSNNLAYLSRPCQFIKSPEEKGCNASYWLERRFTPEVLDAYQTALNDISSRYGVNGFHLVGFDGGANIAAILAATRGDVLSLRTVAGNLNPTVNQHMVLSDDSLSAINYAPTLSRIPQHHFVGAADEVVTPGYYHSYRQNIGQSDCIHYSLIQDADHTHGWVDKWPELLKLTPQCGTVHDDLPPLPETNYGDYYKGKGAGDYRKGMTKPRYSK